MHELLLPSSPPPPPSPPPSSPAGFVMHAPESPTFPGDPATSLQSEPAATSPRRITADTTLARDICIGPTLGFRGRFSYRALAGYLGCPTGACLDAGPATVLGPVRFASQGPPPAPRAPGRRRSLRPREGRSACSRGAARHRGASIAHPRHGASPPCPALVRRRRLDDLS